MKVEAITQGSPLGIMAAMPEEIDALLGDLTERSTTTRAGRQFHSGLLHGRRVVVVFSRWGKVAAASTTTELILDYGVGSIVFFGIAGGIASGEGGVRRGDVVVASGLVQHDLDASPFFAPTHVPMLGECLMPADQAMAASLFAAAGEYLANDLSHAPAELLRRAEIQAPGVHIGVIASGDQVIFSDEARERVRERVPGALCVEMEGAAAGQVCFEHGVPFACVRTVSDTADDRGTEHVQPFLEGLAGVYTRGIAARWLQASPGA